MLGLTPEDVTLAPMPLFHVGGLWYHLFPSFAAGCTTHVMTDFDAGAVLERIARDRITNLHVVPTMLHAILAEPGLAAADLSSLRLVFYAASTIPAALLSRAMDAFPKSEFVQGYGSTEAGAVTVLSAADHRLAAGSATHRDRLLSCGRPFRSVEARLADTEPDGEGGEVGEIVVRSEGAMARYWRNPAATEEAFKEGWLRTGDLARVDMLATLEQAQLYTYHVATMADRGLPITREAATAKIVAADGCNEVCNKALNVFGGYGLMTEYPAQRYLRISYFPMIGGGASDIMRLLAARQPGPKS
jgi:acyl-CoA synthetase (AMP-forming)/AMP-acid ligase II